MATALTVKSLENFKPGPTRREVPDGLLPGLYFIIQPSGKRSWAARYRFSGKPCKLTIGAYPAIGLKAAAILPARHSRRLPAALILAKRKRPLKQPPPYRQTILSSTSRRGSSHTMPSAN